jgi:hypothetical protein
MRRLDPPRVQRRRLAHAQPTPSPLGNFLSLGTPRPVDGRPRQAGFLARGLESLHHLPGLREPSGLRCKAHRLQLRGQPGLIHPSSLKSPYRGTYRMQIRCRKIPRRSTRTRGLPVNCLEVPAPDSRNRGVVCDKTWRECAAHHRYCAPMRHSLLYARLLLKRSVFGPSGLCRHGPGTRGHGLFVCGARSNDSDFRRHHQT